MNKSEGRFFAYVTGLRGPVPVIFHDGIRQSEEATVLMKWPLNEAELAVRPSLARLKAAFPYPVQQMEKPAGQVENSA
jgi:hypothetical protein